MPKIKTHSSSRKRIVRVTPNGKVMVRHMSISHRARFKSKRAKLQANHRQIAAPGQAAKLKELAVR